MAESAICDGLNVYVQTSKRGGVIMRRTLGLALLVGIVAPLVGCFTTEPKPQEQVASLGPPTGEKNHTLEYWGKVREVMQLKSTSPDMRQVAAVVKRQADTVRKLQTDDVDHDLYVAALSIAQCQDKLLMAAETAGYSPAALRADPDLKKSYSSACQQIAAATAYLKALQPKLSARYGVPFPPIED
jgi:hypothetical protein